MPCKKDSARTEDVRKLMKLYRIDWRGFVDKEEWPEVHKTTFAHITQRGNQNFDGYSEDTDARVQDEPWRAQIRNRALLITQKAKRCIEGEKNEDGWRLDLESEVLGRLDVEVACPKCRARLWRSQVEAHVAPGSIHADSLERRRAVRAACTCWTHNHRVEPGLNKLFNNCAGEFIVFEDDLTTKLLSGKKPDRVYGLRATGRFDRIMAKPDKRSGADAQPVAETIISTPFKKKDVKKPVLFPFLVLEAKPESFNGGFSKARAQTAFAIRALLKLQLDLKKATGQASQWESGPLVWFLTNCGESWRVAAAYVDEDAEGDVYYRIVDLWRGVIDSKNEALGLLLIVDYIFDWARDIYRAAVLSELGALVANFTPSLADDSEIASVAQGIPILPHEDFSDEDPSPPPPDEDNEIIGSIPGMRSYKSGTVRDATRFKSQFYALVVTKKDVKPMMACWNPAEAPKKARSLYTVTKCSWRLTEETITSLEQQWTGKIREGSPHVFGTGETFYTALTIYAYLDTSWERVLELSCLAVSENALSECQNFANWESKPLLDFENTPLVTEDALCRFIDSARRGTVGDALWAALNRSCMSSCYTSTFDGHNMIPITSTDNHGGPPNAYVNAPVMAWTKTGELRDFVVTFYQKCKIGRKEPADTFIRNSHRTEEQSFLLGTSIWKTEHTRNLDDNEAVLAYGNYSDHFLCLFFMSGPPRNGLACFNVGDVFDLFQALLEDNTIRERRTNIANFWDHTPWKPLGSMESSQKDIQTFFTELGIFKDLWDSLANHTPSLSDFGFFSDNTDDDEIDSFGLEDLSDSLENPTPSPSEFRFFSDNTDDDEIDFFGLEDLSDSLRNPTPSPSEFGFFSDNTDDDEIDEIRLLLETPKKRKRSDEPRSPASAGPSSKRRLSSNVSRGEDGKLSLRDGER